MIVNTGGKKQTFFPREETSKKLQKTRYAQT